MAANKIPIGVQLYSVRMLCEKDLPGVLRQIAAMGYQGVEFAGYYGRSAGELRSMLDANGLKCCGTHTGLSTLSDENFAATVEFNKALGNPFLIVPGLPRERFASVKALKDTARQFNELSARARPLGMYVGYHAHGGDFKPVEGQIPWEIIFDNTVPEVIMQMDTGNCLSGGGDPYALLRKYPGRSLTVHLKEHGGAPAAPIGEGEVRWSEVFEICETIGGTQWYIVEHEADPNTPMQSIEKCLMNLRRMGK